MKKPVFRTVLSVLLVAVLLVGGTLAYLTATTNPVLNTFALADVETNIEEGETLDTKDPKVANTGESAVYVRARVTLSGVTASEITITYNDEYWEYNADDDFYYYKAILKKGETTKELFTDVAIGSSVDHNRQFSVGVYQESVLATASSWSLADAQDAFANKANAQ